MMSFHLPRSSVLLNICLVTWLFPGAAEAQIDQPLPECTCRAHGARFRLGEQTCLKTPDGYRVAECELTQNITNWRFSKTTCQVSRLLREFNRPPPLLADACIYNSSSFESYLID